MKITKKRLMEIIKEELDLVLEKKKNCFEEEETFDGKVKCIQKQKGFDKERASAYVASVERERGHIPEQNKKLEEAWEGDSDIKQTGEYADKSKEELCKMRSTLKAKKERTKEDSTKLRQINFALRSKQKGPKFGKVEC